MCPLKCETGIEMLEKSKHVTGINQSSKWLVINFLNNYFIALSIISIDYDFLPCFSKILGREEWIEGWNRESSPRTSGVRTGK